MKKNGQVIEMIVIKGNGETWWSQLLHKIRPTPLTRKKVDQNCLVDDEKWSNSLSSANPLPDVTLIQGEAEKSTIF